MQRDGEEGTHLLFGEMAGKSWIWMESECGIDEVMMEKATKRKREEEEVESVGQLELLLRSNGCRVGTWTQMEEEKTKQGNELDSSRVSFVPDSPVPVL